MRVVQGLSISSEQIVAISYHHDLVEATAWSPCGRFIAATAFSSMVEILDAVTLERLDTFKSPPGNQWPSFSPDGCLLTLFSAQQELTSWDLQTGGPIGTISSGSDRLHSHHLSSTYSSDGMMVAAAYGDSIHATTTTAIFTYNLLSRTQMYSHHISEGLIVPPIWTHGECLQFVTVKPGSITIWEVGFASIHTLRVVKSLPAPGKINCSGASLFLPTHSRLAFTHKKAVQIWDTQDSKFLLKFPTSSKPIWMSSSSNGSFFACETGSSGVYLWKESPTGYTLHQTLPSHSQEIIKLLLSPSGESTIEIRQTRIQLRHTRDSIISPPSILAQSTPSARYNYILELSPDEELGAVAQLWEKTAIVLDLKSGSPRLRIDTGMSILGLRVTGSTVVVVGDGKVITWNIPAKDCAPNASINAKKAVQITKLNKLAIHRSGRTLGASISPNLNHIALLEQEIGGSSGVTFYNMSTGRYLRYGGIKSSSHRLWFTQDGCECWCGVLESAATGWTIPKDGIPSLKTNDTRPPSPREPPWESSCGYIITDDQQWVLNSSQERLLWLPTHWRPGGKYITWGRQFLGLLGHELPEPVILELDG